MSLRDNKNEVLPGRSEAIQETNVSNYQSHRKVRMEKLTQTKSKHNHGWRRIVQNFTPA
jgi:hypothetical protein